MMIDRWSKILEILNKKLEISVSDLAKEVDVSIPTIRRDINALSSRQILTCKKGIVSACKVEGLVASGHFLNDIIYLREGINVDTKTQIANFAANMVEDNDIVFIDAGTTVYRMIPFITAKNVYIVTNSVLAISIIKSSGFNAYICPGYLVTGSDSIHDTSCQYIKNIAVSKAFLGARSINKNGFFSSIEDYPMKKVLLENAGNVYVLSDSSKFNKNALYKYASFSDATLITDKIPPFPNVDYIIASI